MTIKHWDVVVPGLPQPACILAHTKSEAIQTALELFPEIDPNSVTLWERPEWN
jgi:hypothetical protein